MSETTILGRAPPHNLPAEQSAIRAMILSENAIASVYQILQTTGPYETEHQVISDTIMNLYSASDSIDPLTLTSTLEKVGKLGQIEGPDHVYILTHVVPIYANTSYYAEAVRDKATLRSLVEAGTRTT